MDLHFCRICQASIPQADLDSGQLTWAQGQAVCLACVPPSTRTAGRGGRRSVGALLIITLVGGLVGGAGYAGLRQWSAQWEVLDRRIAVIETDASGAFVLLAEQAATLEEMAATGRQSRAAVDQASASLEGVRAEIDHLRTALEEDLEPLQLLVPLHRRMEAAESSMRSLEESLARSTEVVRGLQESVGWMGETLPATMESVQSGRPRAQVTPSEEPDATVAGALRRLASEDPGVRWNAVIDVERTGDARLASHLIPLLKDEDEFVRHNAAHALGSFQAQAAVASLVDALEDESGFVRDSVLTALRKVTGQQFGMDPYAQGRDRDRSVAKWKAWLDKNRGSTGTAAGV